MRFKVYDERTKSFVTNKEGWILQPDGRLAINEHGDLIGVPNCVAIFFPDDDDTHYFDGAFGIHEGGCGWAPDGTSCGECSNVSCEVCAVWKEIKG